MNPGIGIVAIIALMLFLIFGRKADSATVPLPKDKRYDSLIRKYAAINGVPFATLKGMIRQESNFDAMARNDERLKGNPSDDAIGLMQIRSMALADYNRDSGRMYQFPDALLDPEINIMVGSWYLGSLARRNGLAPAIQMYNIGETGYKNGRRNLAYADSVSTFAQKYA